MKYVIRTLDQGFVLSGTGRRYAFSSLDDLLMHLGEALERKTVGVEPVLEDDGWREWDGQLKPGQRLPPGVGDGSIVAVRYRNRSRLVESGRAVNFRWVWSRGADDPNHNPASDIVAYKVVPA